MVQLHATPTEINELLAVIAQLQEDAKAIETPKPEPVQVVQQASATTYKGSHDFNPYAYDHLLSQYDWDLQTARAVLLAESEGNASAYNPEWHRGCQGSIGVMQIACLHTPNPQNLYDPVFNIQKAYEIWSREGWRPWGVCHDGSVKCW